MTIREFYLIFALMMQALEKLHSKILNVKQLDVKALHLGINKDSGELELQLLNRNTIHFNQLTPDNHSKRRSKNQSQTNKRQKTSIYKSFIEKINSKPSNRQDIKIVFQNIIQIENFLANKQISNSGLRKSKQKNLSFRVVLEEMAASVEQSGVKVQCLQSWLYFFTIFANQKHQVNIEQLKNEAKKIVNKITINNQNNMRSFIDNLKSSLPINLSLQFIDGDQTKSQDEEYDEFTSHLEIEERISQHKLMANMKFSCHFMIQQ